MNNDLLDRTDSDTPLAKPDLDVVRDLVRDIIKRQGGKARMTSWEKGKFSFVKFVITWKWMES